MPDPAMQPEEDPQLLGDTAPTTVTATMTWSGAGVSIALPNVDEAAPSSVSWDSTNISENSSSRWTSSTSTVSNNSLSAVYAGGTYSNATISRGATSAVLTKR